MKIAAALIALTLAVQNKAIPQEHSFSEAQSLESTVVFLNKIAGPENRLISMENSCKLSIVSGQFIPFVLISGFDRDKNGAKKPLLTIVKDAPEALRFSLGDINPTSIGSFRAMSSTYIENHPNIKTSDLESRNRDLTVVHLRTTDLKESIEFGVLRNSEGGDPTKVMSNRTQRDNALLVFRSEDRANRFITALVHAVQICGGKPDAFPPTEKQ